MAGNNAEYMKNWMREWRKNNKGVEGRRDKARRILSKKHPKEYEKIMRSLENA